MICYKNYFFNSIFRILEREPEVSIELEWSKPTQTYGELLGYRLRYGIRENPLQELLLPTTSHKISQLGIQLIFIICF